MPERVADALVQELVDAGVTHVFGIPGGAIGVLLDVLHRHPDIQYVMTRHEGAAGYMADGYHRATGRLGVVAVTSGPGATNALSGCLNAHFDGSAVLVITGEVPRVSWGRGFLQEGTGIGLDVAGVFRAATGESVSIVDASHAPAQMASALRRAELGRGVHLMLPNDVAGSAMPRQPRRGGGERFEPGCADVVVDRAVEAVLGGRRPLIFIGRGARRALRGERLERFMGAVQRHALPVMTTAEAKGVFPESHPLSLRVYGFASCAWPQLYLDPSRLDATAPPHDALLAVGTTLTGLQTHNWNPLLLPEGPFVQVCEDPAVAGRAFGADTVGTASVAAFLDAWLGRLEEAQPRHAEERAAWVARIRATPPLLEDGVGDASDALVHPCELMDAISEALPANAQVFVDCGNCVGWASHALRIDPPVEAHTSLTMAPMGFGVGAAIGAKIGSPDRPTIGITGDGSLLMHLGELSTAAAHGVGVVQVVLHDDDMRMVTQGQGRFFGRDGDTSYEGAYTLGITDLAGCCRGLGCGVREVRSAREVEAAIDAALADAENGVPQVVIVRHDPRPGPPYYHPAYFSTGPT